MLFGSSQVIQQRHEQYKRQIKTSEQLASLSRSRSDSSSTATTESDDSNISKSAKYDAMSKDLFNHIDCFYVKRRIECDSPISSSQFPNDLHEHQYHPNDDSDSHQEIDYDYYYAPAFHGGQQCLSTTEQKMYERQLNRPDPVDYEDECGDGEEVEYQNEELLEELFESDNLTAQQSIATDSDDSTGSCPMNNQSMPKPFFIMDFLEHVDPDDLKVAQSMLLQHRISRVGSNSDGCLEKQDGNIFQQLTKKLSFCALGSTKKQDKEAEVLAKKERKKFATEAFPLCYKPKCCDTFSSKVMQTLQMPQQPRDELENLPLCAEVKCLSTNDSLAEASSNARDDGGMKCSASNSCFFHQSVAIGNKYNARGILYATNGEWNKALFYWKDALEIRTQVLGEKSIDVADTYNNIGIALGKLHRHEEALSSFHRALRIQIEYYQITASRSNEDLRTASHNSECDSATSTRACHLIATTYHNMGNIYQQSNSYYNAIQCYRECETILKMMYGPTHLEVARSLVAMGHTYRQAASDEISRKETLSDTDKSDMALPTVHREKEVSDCCYSYYYEDAKQAYVDALHIFELLGFQRTNPEVESILDDIGVLENIIKMCL